MRDRSWREEHRELDVSPGNADVIPQVWRYATAVPGPVERPRRKEDPVKTIKFRVRNPMKWVAPLISTVYLIGVVLLCIQNFNYLLLLTGGSRFLFLLALAPTLAPLFLLLWLLSPVRQVRMGEGRFVLAWGDDVLDQLTYQHPQGQVRLTVMPAGNGFVRPWA